MSQSQAAPPHDYHAGDQPVPGYTLVRELGRGAMGVVWLAQTDSGFERALKIINLQQRGGKKEYRGLRIVKQRKLLHGNLLTLIDYWLKDRDGRFIPDSDELASADSFFAPPQGPPTAPQSAAPGDVTAANYGAATRVAGTRVNLSAETPSGGLDKTIEQSQPPRPAQSRPAQLIVAMELGHRTLDDRQKQCQADDLPGVPIEELLAYMEQAARGLDYLHREGIVHRDIKPQNIMLVGDVAKVCDYGLVVTIDADLRATSNAFTPLYASPEAVRDQLLTAASDQYSLAVTYIELRTGHTPYASETAATVYAAKETGKYDLSRIRSAAVRTVLKRALARLPSERFASCSAFIRELEKAENRSSGLLWAAATAALLIVGIAAALAAPQLRSLLLPDEAAPKANRTGVAANPDRTPATDVPAVPATESVAVSPAPPPLVQTVEPARVATAPVEPAPPPMQDTKPEVATVPRETAPRETKEDENRRLAESLAKQLTKDDFLVDSDVRTRLLDWLRSLGPRSDLPLTTLLRIEAELVELDASDKQYPMALLKELRELIGHLGHSGDATPQEWLDYARFLLARAEIHSQRDSTEPAQLTAQADMLLGWPDEEKRDWHTPHRKEQVTAALLQLADALLPWSEKDVLRLSDPPPEWTSQAAVATTYLDKAQRLGSRAPELPGLLAVALSLGAQQIEAADPWPKIAAYADQALSGWGRVSDAARKTRLPTVQYVSAVAASHVRDPAATARNRQAVATFARLLKQHFHDEEPRNADSDRETLEKLVLPGLAVPLQGSDAPAGDLAALWAAKGRLIERNPGPALIAIRGVNPLNHADDNIRSLLTAHAAFVQALKLNDNAQYAAGSARTLLKLPRESLDWATYESELARLVENHAQAAPTNSSLELAQAQLLRRKALAASQRAEKLRLAEQAIDRFARLDAMTRSADPYAIRAAALCAASENLIEAAGWTPMQSADEAKNADSARTKYVRLHRALDDATAAQSDPNLLFAEEAATAKGKALEDLAYHYKNTADYQRSAAAYQEALEKIGRRRSKAYALMCLGRCQYRWAIDAARFEGHAEDRVKHLHESYQSLSDALAYARSGEPSVAPEASFWMSTVVWESALEGPGNLDWRGDEASRGFRASSLAKLHTALQDSSRKADAAKELAERLGLMEQARRSIVRAAEAARAQSPVEWAHYLPTAAFLGKKLTDELSSVQGAVTTNLVPAAITVEVRKQVDDLLALAEQQPESLSAGERRSLVDLLVRLQMHSEPSPQKAAQLAAQTYQNSERLFADDSDESRVQLVLLKLIRANASGAGDFSQAEQLAGRIADPRLASWARGSCEKFKADALLRPYRDRLKAYLRDPQKSTALTLADEPKLQAIQEAYSTALSSLNKSSDPKTQENLVRLCQTPLDEIESGKWHAKLTNLEVELLRQNIDETERLVRGQLYELLDTRVYLHRGEWSLADIGKPLPEAGRAVVRQILDCLKPPRFLEVRFGDAKMDNDLRKYLRMCEARLAK